MPCCISVVRQCFLSVAGQGEGVPRYECSTATPLDAREAQGRVLGTLSQALASSSGTPGSSSSVRAPSRRRCWNCGSYAHDLKVGRFSLLTYTRYVISLLCVSRGSHRLVVVSLQDCWQKKGEEAIGEARRAAQQSGRKPGLTGPKRCARPMQALPTSQRLSRARGQPKVERSLRLDSCAAPRYFLGGPEEDCAGLRPGQLSDDLRQALGMASSAPPPWLPRMRLLGYPPGYR